MTHSVKAPTTAAAGKVIYTARTRTIGGRENGLARSSDGRLDVKLSLPGTPRIGTNPEQLFAAGWSACLESAIALVARKRKAAVAEIIIDAEVDYLADGDNCWLRARFNVSLPGLDHEVAKSLIVEAEQLCPYSKATRGNIEVAFKLI